MNHFTLINHEHYHCQREVLYGAAGLTVGEAERSYVALKTAQGWGTYIREVNCEKIRLKSSFSVPCGKKPRT